MKSKKADIIGSVSKFQYEKSSNEKYILINEDILSKLFFDQFYFMGFSELVETSQNITLAELMDSSKSDYVNVSAYVFKVFAVLSLKGFYQQGIIFLNSLLETYHQRSMFERAYVIIKFILWFGETRNYSKIDRPFYTSIMEEYFQEENNVRNELDQVADSTIMKYQVMEELVGFFLSKNQIPIKHLKLLHQLFFGTYRFDDDRYQGMDFFTINCLIFDNSEIHEKLENVQNRLNYFGLRKTKDRLFSNFRFQTQALNSFLHPSLYYFVT